jgi:PAS domain-containing protein
MHAIKEEDDDDDADSNSNGSLVDSEAALKMEEMRRNPPANLFEGGQPDQGLWNATLHQLFGNEYAFPLVNTNVPPQSQPKDYGLPLLPSSVSPYTVESPESSPFDADNNWLSQLIGDSSPATSSSPTSPAEESQRSSGFSSPDTSLVHNSVMQQQRSWLKNSGGMMQLGAMPTVGHSGVARMTPQAPAIKPPSPALAPLSPGSVSSRTVNILQEMKAKNDRLERLLRNALDDIKELKHREQLREQHNITMQSLVQLQNIGPADEFRKGVPALAMFALSEERHGAILQANETFRNLVGYSFEHLASPGFTCCKLFPERFKNKLCKDYQAIMSGAKSSGQDDLVIMRGDAKEVPVRAFYHIIYDDVGRPLYKMFYAFPLA